MLKIIEIGSENPIRKSISLMQFLLLIHKPKGGD